MELYRKSQFFVSPPAVLKAIQMVVLVTGVILFLVDNRCASTNVGFMLLYMMPAIVCAVAALVTYISAVFLLLARRNPLSTPAWLKGDVSVNIAATIVMSVGSIITLTTQGCVENSLTVAAIAMGFISIILFASCGAVTYLLLHRHREETEEASQRQNQLQNRRVTMSVIA